MKMISGLAVAAGLLAVSLPATAAEIGLNEYAFNIDGGVTVDSAPGSVNLAAFDTLTGLGTVTVTVSGAGSHYVGMFVDHDFTGFNNGFDNEYGVVNGAAAAGQSWEIDEPGALFGDIFANFSASALDNTNALPFGSADDVSMALAWSFELTAGQTASVTFLLSQVAPAGFSLQQVDTGPITFILPTGDEVFFSSTLEVRGGPVVPIPPAVVLFGSGLAALAAVRRRRRAA